MVTPLKGPDCKNGWSKLRAWVPTATLVSQRAPESEISPTVSVLILTNSISLPRGQIQLTNTYSTATREKIEVLIYPQKLIFHQERERWDRNKIEIDKFCGTHIVKFRLKSFSIWIIITRKINRRLERKTP